MNGKTVYIKIHAPWEVLAKGAEEMTMRMPTIVRIHLKHYSILFYQSFF